MERLVVQTPQNASEFVQQTWPDGFLPAEPHLFTYPEIRQMDENELLRYISEDIASAEESLFGDKPDIESKLAFLGGSKKWDISGVKTKEKEGIYKTRPRYMKNSEIHEFAVVANLVTNEGVSEADFAGEAADIFYNLVRAWTLDQSYPDKPDYLEMANDLAAEIGWTRREAFLLTAAKYHRRFVEARKKDPQGEKGVIEGLFVTDRYEENAKPYVPLPTHDQINSSAKLLLKLQKITIRPRYVKIRFEKERRGLIQSNRRLIFG